MERLEACAGPSGTERGVETRRGGCAGGSRNTPNVSGPFEIVVEEWTLCSRLNPRMDENPSRIHPSCF